MSPLLSTNLYCLLSNHGEVREADSGVAPKGQHPYFHSNISAKILIHTYQTYFLDKYIGDG